MGVCWGFALLKGAANVISGYLKVVVAWCYKERIVTTVTNLFKEGVLTDAEYISVKVKYNDTI